MTHKYPLIAAGVAAALAGGYVQAAPTIAQAAAATQTLNITGSSAAKNAVLSGLEADVCGGSANALLVSSAGGTKNFFALSCNTATVIPGITTGSLVTFYYRTEGGSVVGALPIATGKQIKRLNLSDASCTGSGLTATCTVNGSTTTNGPNDSWTGAVINDVVDLGVTDVEPGQLTGADYPSGYSSAVFGSATTAQMKALGTVRLVDQTFGLAVNVSGRSFSTVNLTRESAANILSGSYSDWHSVPDALTGQPISSVTTGDPITVVNREPGSGTRTTANIYFLGYQCSSTNSIPGATGNFSTTDELNQVNGTPGAIGYTAIDQLQDPHNSTNFTNLVLATINGVAPSNLASATGQYDYWYEATLVPNPATTGTSLSLSQFLQTDLPKLGTAPQEPSINAIPGVGGNVAAVPLTSNGKTGTLQIYINPYTRQGKSCNVPAEQN
jgi:PBP superfamily domain